MSPRFISNIALSLAGGFVVTASQAFGSGVTGWLAASLLARVLPSALLDWYRSPEGQWFHDVMAVRAQGDRDPKALEAEFNRRYAVSIDRVSHATAYLYTHGARLLFGTDTPSAPTYANPPGLNGWLEMHRLVAAGVTPEKIFRSATLSNAQALKLDQDVGPCRSASAPICCCCVGSGADHRSYAGMVKVLLGGRDGWIRPTLFANRGQ